MATFKIAFKAATGEAKILASATAIPGGFTNAGTFDHVADVDDNLGVDHNHALWHHVRDAMYKAGVQDMARIKITLDNGVTIPAPT